MIDTLTPSTIVGFDAAQRAEPRQDRPASAPVFAGFMDRARSEGGTAREQLREASEKLVATTFIMPMFERMRDDPLASGLIHGGRGETIFQQQMDQLLSDRIAGATNFDLVDSVYRELEKDLNGQGVIAHG